MDDLIHIAFDFFNVVRYIIENLGSFFTYLFVPLAALFNFVKGFFQGITTPPPATAISWVFPDNIMAVFNAIPYFNLLELAVGAGLAILIVNYIMRRLSEF